MKYEELIECTKTMSGKVELFIKIQNIIEADNFALIKLNPGQKMILTHSLYFVNKLLNNNLTNREHELCNNLLKFDFEKLDQFSQEMFGSISYEITNEEYYGEVITEINSWENLSPQLLSEFNVNLSIKDTQMIGDNYVNHE